MIEDCKCPKCKTFVDPYYNVTNDDIECLGDEVNIYYYGIPCPKCGNLFTYIERYLLKEAFSK